MNFCSHEDIDVSHPEFFAAAKMNGYIPPNKEVTQHFKFEACIAHSCDFLQYSNLLEIA